MTMVDAGQQWMHTLLLNLRWVGSVVACIVFTYKAPHFTAILTDLLRPRPIRPARDSRPSAVRWQAIQRDHDRIKDEYGQLCIDPFRSAELAVLDNLAVPEAVALIQALAEANDAAETTDSPTYEQAVLRLAKAWRHAQALTDSTGTSPGAELAWHRPHPPIPRERRTCR
ncbi:hypothetical protein [Streptomyces sp. A1136]|uniref:hypothetical protein n=1 Tax=Streptomyces sp. A1136 TaxID=2563102 RepID=UPI00109E47D4|nr:hypothetical protein [Streptomyces sp. A1136]THA53220.1 hypothetical protein E6R62_19195 [Streptomyces sp. A1136]